MRAWARAHGPALGLLLLFALGTLAPMAQPGYWWGAHDARHSVYFLFEFDQAFRDTWWPRWAPDFAFGYGYPFFNVYGPLTLFVGETFHRLGFDLVASVKLTLALGVLGSGLAMYGLAQRLFGHNAALLAAVAWLYLPYHLADLYVRAALAESWAFVWLPLVLWGFYECVAAPRPRTVALTALGYAAFFLTHPGLVIQSTLLLMGWTLWWLWDLRWFRTLARRPSAVLGRPSLLAPVAAPLAAALLGPMVGGLFVLPWLLEARFVNQDQWFQGYFDYGKHFVEGWQLLSPVWGFGTSELGVAEDNFPFQLGALLLLLAVAAWALPMAGVARRARTFFTGMLAAYVLLMVPLSRPLWDSPLGQVVLRPMQFPWRFLILAGLALAALAGSVGQRLALRETLLMALLVVAGSWGFVRAELIEPPEGPVSHAGLMRFQRSAGELTGQSDCVALADIPTWSPLADVWVAGGTVRSRFDYGRLPTAGNAQAQSNQELIEVRLAEPQSLRWYITDYPGWRAYRLPLERDGPLEPLAITPLPGSCHLTVEAPAGHYRLLVRFEETPVRRVGAGFSLVGLALLAALWLWPMRGSPKVPPERRSQRPPE